MELMPQSYECEVALLGCIIENNSILTNAMAELDSEYFYNNNCKKHYKYFTEQYKLNKKFDIVVLTDEFPDERMDFANYFDNANVDMADYYIKIIKETSLKRKIIEFCYKAQEKSNIPFSEFIMEINNNLDELAELQTKKKDFNLKQDLEDALSELEEKSKMVGYELPTGFTELDDMLGGLHRRRLVTLGAKSGYGKTSFLVSLTNNLIKKNKKVLFLSLEMAKEEIYYRLFTIRTEINNKKILIPKLLTLIDWQNLTKEQGIMNTEPLVVIDSDYDVANISLEIEKHKPDVVIIDFLQHMKFKSQELQNFALFLSRTCRDLKAISKRYKVAIVIGSQLNKELELKASGGILENSDIVLKLVWKFRDIEDEDKKVFIDERQIEVAIKKNRGGKLGKVSLLFEPEYTSFKNWK